MANVVLQATHLTKRFGPAGAGFIAVNNISFSVKEGEIVGLLGPNGAGKTTTIHTLLGLITPTSGTISYFGKSFDTNREFCLSHINFASAYAELQGRMTVEENLRIYAGLYGVKQWRAKAKEVLTLLEIEEAAHTLFWRLSSGQKTRVILAKCLINNPKLILMDEPTASLDPDIASKVIDLIQRLQKEEGVGILYTSHDMSEVEKLCDRVMFLDHGKIVAEDTPLGLTKRIGKSELILTFDGKPDIIESYLRERKFVCTFPRKQVVSVHVAEKEIPKVLFGLSNQGVWLTNIDIKKPDLEDVFLSVARGSYEAT
jgi:ABC-2 type transport system ATP-binding protein